MFWETEYLASDLYPLLIKFIVKMISEHWNENKTMGHFWNL